MRRQLATAFVRVSSAWRTECPATRLTMVGERIVFATFVESARVRVTAVYRMLNQAKLRRLGYEVFERPKREHGGDG